jgi:uncharacterized membrane protein YgdD (TMEM256/DUF423 family)
MSTLNSATRLWLVIGAILGGLAVALGAFGAHGLESHLRGPDGSLSAAAERSMATWETAARYQMYHALAILVVGLLSLRPRRMVIQSAGWTMTVGVLIFSGCLYALVLSEQKFLGRIVPIGGVFMLVGWGLLAAGVSRLENPVESDRP